VIGLTLRILLVLGAMLGALAVAGLAELPRFPAASKEIAR
jgi:hypothetical protein